MVSSPSILVTVSTAAGERLYLKESGYRLQSEVSFTVSGGEVTYGGDATTLTLVLLSNDAVVSGTLKPK